MKLKQWVYKSLLLGPDRRSDCKCCKILTFPYPTTLLLLLLKCTYLSDTVTRNAAGALYTGDSSSRQLLPRDAMLARYMLTSCVYPSVCPSQAGTVPNR